MRRGAEVLFHLFCFVASLYDLHNFTLAAFIHLLEMVNERRDLRHNRIKGGFQRH